MALFSVIVLAEALNLYTTGIDLLMHRARAEPVGAKKQRIAQEAEIYMTRAENLKAALAPTRTRGSGRGGAQGARGGRGSVARRGGRRGTEEKRLLPDSSDVWGSARVSPGMPVINALLVERNPAIMISCAAGGKAFATKTLFALGLLCIRRAFFSGESCHGRNRNVLM